MVNVRVLPRWISAYVKEKGVKHLDQRDPHVVS